MPWIVLVLVVFTMLTVVWVKGLGAVQRYQPEKAVTFYFLVAAVRFVVAITIVALYMLLSEHTR